MKRAQGYNVLHPMGWDAFGLPAEQYALDTGNDPAEFTKKNIETFRRQINSLDSAMIGIVKLIPLILNITNGHNGYLQNYMKRVSL